MRGTRIYVLCSRVGRAPGSSSSQHWFAAEITKVNILPSHCSPCALTPLPILRLMGNRRPVPKITLHRHSCTHDVHVSTYPTERHISSDRREKAVLNRIHQPHTSRGITYSVSTLNPIYTLHSAKQPSRMPIPMQTTTEKPSTSSTEPSSSSNSAIQQASSSVPDADAGGGSGSSAARQTRSEVEKAADKLYEERMEEEYAKREGGA